MNDDNRHVLTLFTELLEAGTPEEQAAYLDQACGGDLDLRTRLEALLHAHREAGGFLGGAAPAPDSLGTVIEAPAGCDGPGTVIGPYKLLQQIGEGGMGTVYMAEQSQPVRRMVALKIIKPGMDSRQVIARFEAEQQALALMDHPNIAKVLDAGTTASGRPFFVMELVKGVPITKYCDEHRLTPKQRLEQFVQVCQAVQHAHQKGIIHRDLKPSNVMVCLYDGKPVPKVIDFGIAKATGQKLTDRTLFTEIGQVVGTLEYMSPEQAELNQLDIDTRSDVYSLGVLLYELLTGSTPLERKRLKAVAMLEVLRLIREEEAPKPSTRLSTTDEMPSVAASRGLEPKKLSGLVRGELDWIVIKALDKNRTRRYETANGLTRDVQRYLADEPVLACPPSAWYRFRKFARRNKGGLTAAAAVVVALVLATGVSTWSWRQAEAGAERARQAERTTRLREAEALVGQARGTRLSRRPGQRFETLATLGKAAAIGRELGQSSEWFDALRNEAIAALALPDLHITREWAGFPPGSGWVALSDDFEVYARTTDKGGCTVRRVADDTEIASPPELGERAEAGFGPAQVLALRGDPAGRFQLWDVSSAERSPRIDKRDIERWGFHPNGRLVALAHFDGAISVHEVATGKCLHRLEPGGVSYFTPVFHPTEPLLAICSYKSRVVTVRNFWTGAVVASATPPWNNGNGGCAWSPDGRTLLVPDGELSGKIQEYAFDPAATPALRPMRTFAGPAQGDPQLIFNPAGDRFVSRGWATTVNLFDVVSGQLLFTTPPFALAGCYDLRFDRTGKWLAAARVGERSDGIIGLWSVAEGREYRSLVPGAGIWRNPGPVQGAAIHREGRLAAVSLTGGLALFDLESGRELENIPIPGERTDLAFDGEGNLYSNGFAGCFRWPVRPDPADAGRLIVGPPEQLPFQPGNRPISSSRDGRVIAQSMFNGYGMSAHAGGWILHPNSPTPRRVGAPLSMNFCSVSADGRWVAFSANDPYLGHVYDTATGQRVWQSPANNGGKSDYYYGFSQDGRWLMTAQDGGRLYAAGTWTPGPQLGPGVPWDATSDLAVMGEGNGIYRLVQLTTGRELARLEDPEQNSNAAFLTSDGTKLVITAGNGLRVWDLRLVRRQLAAMGLDWDAPPYPPAAANNTPRLSVTVDRGDKLDKGK